MQETWVGSLGQEEPPGGRNGNPLQYSCQDTGKIDGAWQGTVHRVTKSWTRLSDWAHTYIHIVNSKKKSAMRRLVSLDSRTDYRVIITIVSMEINSGIQNIFKSKKQIQMYI